MAAYSGTRVPDIGNTIGALRPTWFDAPITLNDGDGWLASGALIGAYASTQPVDENPVAVAGTGGFNIGAGGLFYNRIHIAPTIIDLGNLLTVQERTVELWNGFLENKELEVLAWENAEGVSISTPTTVPTTLLPLQNLIYTITSTTDGPSTIDARFLWQIDGELYQVRVVGNRVVVFPFLPNWKAGISEELSWLSTVERAYDGSEQRRELRNAPRKGLSYNIALLDQHEVARLENYLFGWQARNFAVPLPTSKSQLTATAVQGTSTTLYLNTINRGFYVGQSVILMRSSDDYEAIEITAVLPASIDIARPVVRTWPVGTRAYAAGVAHLPNQQQLLRASDYYATAALEWMFEVNDANADLPVEAAAVTYRGQEVYLKKFNWAQRPTFSYDDAFVTFGADGTGPLEFEQTSDWPMIVRQHSWLLKNRDEIVEFRAFLKRRAGRVVPVWLPTWNSDFIVTENVTSTSAIVTVRDNGYRAFVGSHAARCDIAIFVRGQALPIRRRIVDTVDNLDGTINLVLDTQVGLSFTVDQVKRVCHMNLFRLGSDKITLVWRSSEVVSVTLNCILVKG